MIQKTGSHHFYSDFNKKKRSIDITFYLTNVKFMLSISIGKRKNFFHHALDDEHQTNLSKQSVQFA
jgi:hypothetical protein